MNVQYLKSFIAVADSGNFSEAAERLFTTQSTVSKQVATLERELKVRLFDRSNRKTTLTEHGKVVLQHARKIAGEGDALMTALAEISRYDERFLPVASIPVMAQYGIAALIAGFQKKFPEVNMAVDECEAREILSLLDKRNYELVFMRSDFLDNNNYEWTVVCSDRLLVVLPEGHKLAERDTINLVEIKNEKFLFLGKETLLYELCIMECEKAGFTPMVAFSGIHAENILELVASGMGVSLMMAKTVSYVDVSGVSGVPLNEETSSKISLVRRKNLRLSKAGKLFWDFIQNRFACP